MRWQLHHPPGGGPAEAAYAYTGGRAGDTSLPCVVFVHGALNDHSVWTLCARWFAHHGYNVLAVDLPGHGRSDGAPRDSVEAMAQWLWALAEAAGVGEAALVGHSMGSLVALQAAALHPERVRRLVMVGTAYPMKVSSELLDAAREHPESAIDRVNAFSLSTLAAKPSYPGPGNWLHGANRILMRRLQSACTSVNLFERDFSACDRYGAGLQAAAQVCCPTHFILGERDQMTQPRHSEALAQALQATVHRLDAGHSLMAEAPDALLGALRTALA